MTMHLKQLERTLQKNDNFANNEQRFKLETLKVSPSSKIPTIINILRSSDNEMVQYILYKYNFKLAKDDFEPVLLDFLKTSKDVYIKFKTCQILTRYYENSLPKQEYFIFVKQHLRSDSYDAIDQVLHYLADLLYNKRGALKIVNEKVWDRNCLKINFCEDETFITSLQSLIKVNELQYNILKIIFILSYNTKCLAILESHNLLIDVVKILKQKSREKLMRMCTAIIRNSVDRGFKFTILTAHEIIDICSDTYNDHELNADNAYLKDVLSVYLKSSSNIESYFNELFSGKLEASPYHYSDTFFESNLEELLNRKIEIIKAIKKYLKSSNKTCICVSANDLYRFIRVAPEIKIYVTKYGLQDDLFTLTNSDDPDVRFHAIQALSGCIFSEWSK